jgi:multidrug efflux pump subunit AcrA (membrane-fusion protein)
MGAAMTMVSRMLFGVTFALILSGCEPKEKSKDEGSEKSADPIDVYAQTLAVTEMYDPIMFAGFVNAKEEYSLVPEVTGYLTEIQVRLGQRVVRGQPLFSVQPMTSGMEFQRHIVSAPSSGTVIGITQRIGSRVSTSTPVVRLANVSELTSILTAASQDLSAFEMGTKLQIQKSRDIGSESIGYAVVSGIAPQADAATGGFSVQLKLYCHSTKDATCPEQLGLGTMAYFVKRNNLRSGIRIPVSQLHSQRKKVLIVEDGKAKWLPVKLGSYFGAEVEILEGLSAGMNLVTSFSERPEDGRALRIVPEDKGPEVSAKPATEKAKS